MVKGAVLHGTAPRLLHIDGIDVEAPLERNLIYLRNRDVPGVIGKVGTILGESEINIADFSLGRRAWSHFGAARSHRRSPRGWQRSRRCAEKAREDSGSSAG